MKKLIAVVPLWDETKNSIWMLPGYMDGIMEAGGIPIILPLHSNAEDVEEVFDRCDGLLMTGGHDVSPSLYHDELKDTCGVLCEDRDRIESALYRRALEQDKPVLGICRGIQIINVFQGGTLYQDLPTEHPSKVEHHMKPPYTDISHYVNIREQSPLYKLLRTNRLGVNSCHHQAIKNVGADLEVMAEAGDGIVEAVALKGKSFVWGIQWHPEFSLFSDPASRMIFKAFVDATGMPYI